MSPTPLQAFGLPVHLGAIAVDDAAVVFAQQLGQGISFAAGENREHGEHVRDRRPQPSLLIGLFRGGLVPEDLRLLRQCLLQFVVRRLQRGRHLILHFDRQRRTAGKFQQVLQEQRRATFALPEVTHQQAREGHQVRSRLTTRYAQRQGGTRRLSAARTGQAMLLIFGDDRLDHREFPDLMTPWLQIAPPQPFATARANLGTQRDHLAALIRRNQLALVPWLPRLPTTFASRFALERNRLRMRMLTAGGQRRILRSQLLQLRLHVQQLRFQFLNLGQQQPNDRLSFRRLSRNQFFRDDRQHHRLIAETLESRQIASRIRERLLGIHVVGIGVRDKFNFDLVARGRDSCDASFNGHRSR